MYNITELPRFQKNFGRPYIYKNALLLMASEWFIDDKTLPLINGALPVMQRFENEEGLEDPEPTRS